MKTSLMRKFVVSFLVALLVFATPQPAVGSESEPTTSGDATVEEVQEQVDEATDREVEARRERIVAEAVAALDETRSALASLDEEKPDEALAALERATGKLEILLAREPDLAFAPVDVRVTTHDLITSVDAIEEARDHAEDLLEDGRIQDAREILTPLGSEVIVSVVSLPLATYPQAIKAVSPMIDRGETKEAAAALQAALNTQVVTNHIIPLPVLRAERMLEEAKRLSELEDRDEGDAEKLAALLEEARAQLRIAEALGYGTRKAYEDFHASISEIEGKSSDGETGNGWFDGIQKSLSEFRISFYDN